MDKLNEKLALWAGFTYSEDGDYQNGMWVDISVWLSPKDADGDREVSAAAPDFTDSLDLCFQYLVPKMVDYYLDMVNLGGPLQYHAAVLGTWDGILWGASDTTPALALCKAIEKLIDAEAK